MRISRSYVYIYEGNKEKLMYYPAAMSTAVRSITSSAWWWVPTSCKRYTRIYPETSGCWSCDSRQNEKLNEILSDKNGISPGYSFKGQMSSISYRNYSVNDLARNSVSAKKKYSGTARTHDTLSSLRTRVWSPKKPLFPEAEMLHYLDIVDARMFDMEEGSREFQTVSSVTVWPLIIEAV